MQIRSRQEEREGPLGGFSFASYIRQRDSIGEMKYSNDDDYRAGFNDGDRDVPRRDTDNRCDSALIAYLSGYADGQAAHSQYLDDTDYES